MTDFTEARSMLKKKALAEKGDTPTRRAYYNLMEMMESHDKTSDFDQRVQLKANINRELARLDDLSQSQH
jgi:flagellar biosynthesis/type III secretory pathway M-ring protein FliF/YscJ